MVRSAFLFGVTVVAVFLFAATTALGGGKYTAKGLWVEGCSCMGVCPCELTGLKDGCEGVGAVSFDKGSSYMGKNLTGAKVAYATVPGKWIRFYVDAKDPEVNKAARDFAAVVFKDFGKVESVADAKVDITGAKGKYSVMVDDGNIAKFQTEPVMGGDKKTPVSHGNIMNPLVPTVMQGKTITASYKDGDKSMTLEGSNSYFNEHMNSKGEL